MRSPEEVVVDLLDEVERTGVLEGEVEREIARAVADGVLVELRREGLLREGTIGQRTRRAVLEAARSSALSRSSSLEERANEARREAGHAG